MSRSFVFDIDGTLIHHKKLVVEDSTKKILKDLTDKGFPCYLATGRSFLAVKATGIDRLCPWSGYVLNNGQRVLDKNLSPIYEKAFDPSLVQAVLDLCKDQDASVLAQSEGWLLLKDINDAARKTHEIIGSDLPHYVPYHGQAIYSLLVYAYDLDFLKVLEDKIHIMPGQAPYADLTLEGISKASGLSYLNLENMVVFGDSLNDLTMFEMADFSVASHYGNAKLKQVASYISPYEDDEILKCIQELKLDV